MNIDEVLCRLYWEWGHWFSKEAANLEVIRDFAAQVPKKLNVD